MRLLTACLLLVMIAGCAAKKTAVSKSAATSFSGGKWVIYKISGMEIDPSKAGKEPPYMDFNLAEKRMNAFAGCNRMNAGFSISNDTITFSQMISTRMACPDMDYEYALERLLVPGNYTYYEHGSSLQLFYNGSMVLDFKRVPLEKSK